MNTDELARRLEEEGFNSLFYCIGPGWRRLADGYALDRAGDSFEWFYVERGQKGRAERVFTSEEEACRFAYEALSRDKWARSHMVGMFESEAEAADFARALSHKGIRSETDRIPYGGPDDPRFRVFVYGRDVFRVKDSAG
ncbi:MAG TPA: hypothetical protein VG148_06340 [Pyrinomonadaceae bacterium]|nr:hypothetical protein [Pyrinomonadaceae bacterium]